MLRALGVAVALCAAGPALAKGGVIASVDHAVIDFEEYQVGDVLTYIDKYGQPLNLGQPLPFIGVSGIIEGDATNKYLRLFENYKGDAIIRHRNLTMGNAGDDAVVMVRTYHSIDVFTELGGCVTGTYGLCFANVPAAQWSTIALGLTGEGNGRLKVLGEAPALIDNLVYSAVLSHVPEPATWAMLLVGFGAAGSRIRASRRRPATA